jgi:hypothetical protein
LGVPLLTSGRAFRCKSSASYLGLRAFRCNPSRRAGFSLAFRFQNICWFKHPPFRHSGNLCAHCSSLSGVSESFVHIAAPFPAYRNPLCTLQHPFRHSGKLPARCGNLSGVPETFLQLAACCKTAYYLFITIHGCLRQ